jgi:hypothetical protein
LVIRDGGTDLAAVWQLKVTGELAVPPGETSNTLEIFWLDQDSTEFQPSDARFTLGHAIANPSFVSFQQVGQWTFTITGITIGSTEIVFRLLDNDVPQYTSPPIPLHCELEHAEPVGLVIRRGTTDVAAAWEGTVTGQITVLEGLFTDSLDVVFLAEDSTEFVPDDPEFEFRQTVADTNVATITQLGDWSFNVRGKVDGSTTCEMIIFHIDHNDFTSPPIPIVVTNSTDIASLGTRDDPEQVLRLGAYPNPSVSGVRIDFDLRVSGEVDLAVFDASGRRVATLARGFRPAGAHTVAWSIPEGGSGIYFLRCTVPGGSATRRVVFLPAGASDR